MSEETAPRAGPDASGLRAAPRPRRWLAVVLGLTIFVSGVVLGGVGALTLQRQFMIHQFHHPEKTPARLTGRIQKHLELTGEQAGEVEEIIRHAQTVLQQVQREFQPRIAAEFDRVQQEVAAVLDEEQARKWNDWYMKTRETWTPRLPAGEEASPDPAFSGK